MSLPQLTAQLREETIKGVSIQHQFDALVKLYEAAAIIPNNLLMEQYRDQLHSLLDLRLDTANTIYEITRRMVNES